MKTSKIYNPSFLFIPLIFFVAVSCSDTSVVESIPVEVEVTDSTPKRDSSSIFILSEEGELLQEKRYFLPVDERYEDANEYPYREFVPYYLNTIRGYPDGDTIIGDFNGDGKLEKAWLKSLGMDAYYKCKDQPNVKNCMGYVTFSDKSIKELAIEYGQFGTLHNEGDLNGNGKDEIGFIAGGSNGSCRVYEVFTLTNNGWVEACKPISMSLNMREAGIVVIEKDPNQTGNALIRESVDSHISGNVGHKIPGEYYQGKSSCRWSNVVERSVELRG